MLGKITITFDFPLGKQCYSVDEKKAFEILQSILMSTDVEKTEKMIITEESLSIPDAESITTYIKSRENYTFTIEDVFDHFFPNSSNIDKAEKTRLSNAIRAKIHRIRANIAYEENGKWNENKSGLAITYTFVKNKMSNKPESEMDKWT